MIALFPNTGFLSETSRMLSIARALEALGTPTVLASHGGPYDRLLDEAGVEWVRLDPRTDEAGTTAFLDALLDMGRGNAPLYPMDFLRGAVAAEAEFLRDEGAQMAVVGFNLPTLLSARVAGIPVAASHGGSFVPPVMERGLCPLPVNPADPSMLRLPQFLQRWIVAWAPRFIAAPMRTLNALADELGVDRVGCIASVMLGDLTLVTDVPEILGVPREELESWRPGRFGRFPRPSELRYTGPLFAKLDVEIPLRVQEFLDHPDPLVFLSPTSVKEAFLRRLISAAKEADVRVLVGATIHDVVDVEDERTLVAGVLPNHLIMPQVDVAVIMGGQGSVQTAMTSGTPFVGLPYHGEQELNVALAERQGMAVRMSPDDATTSRLTDAIRTLLDNPEAKQAGQRVKEIYAGIDGAHEAARAIVEYLETRRMRHPEKEAAGEPAAFRPVGASA